MWEMGGWISGAGKDLLILPTPCWSFCPHSPASPHGNGTGTQGLLKMLSSHHQPLLSSLKLASCSPSSTCLPHQPFQAHGRPCSSPAAPLLTARLRTHPPTIPRPLLDFEKRFPMCFTHSCLWEPLPSPSALVSQCRLLSQSAMALAGYEHRTLLLMDLQA